MGWQRQFLVMLLLISAWATPAMALNCVQFVRAHSNFSLQGNAWMWWGRAAGHYERGHNPEAGAVLVFSRSGRMVHGHVALVNRQLDNRTIIINHANWDDRRGYKGRVDLGIRVIDVSAQNDWTAVRVWHPKYQNFGRVYPTKGFIYPRQDGAGELIQASYNPTEPTNIENEFIPSAPPSRPANRSARGLKTSQQPFIGEIMLTSSANLAF